MGLRVPNCLVSLNCWRFTQSVAAFKNGTKPYITLVQISSYVLFSDSNLYQRDQKTGLLWDEAAFQFEVWYFLEQHHAVINSTRVCRKTVEVTSWQCRACSPPALIKLHRHRMHLLEGSLLKILWRIIKRTIRQWWPQTIDQTISCFQQC